MTKYKYEEQYMEYESFSLREEFELAKDYLLLNNEHANNEVFDAVDEIYHWFCIKTDEVEKLLEENARLKEGTQGDPLVAALRKAASMIYKNETLIKRFVTETYKVLMSNGIKDVDSFAELKISKVYKCRGANSGVIATIATAQEILRAND